MNVYGMLKEGMSGEEMDTQRWDRAREMEIEIEAGIIMDVDLFSDP